MDPQFQALLNALAAADADYRTRVQTTLTASAAYQQAVNNWGNNPTLPNATLASLAWNNFNSALDAQQSSLSALQAAAQAVNDFIGLPALVVDGGCEAEAMKSATLIRGRWQCPRCGARNSAKRATCRKCKGPRP